MTLQITNARDARDGNVRVCNRTTRDFRIYTPSLSPHKKCKSSQNQQTELKCRALSKTNDDFCALVMAVCRKQGFGSLQ